MTPDRERAAVKTSRKQLAVIAALVVAGVIAAIAILRGGPSTRAGGDAHGQHDTDNRADDHADDHADSHADQHTGSHADATRQGDQRQRDTANANAGPDTGPDPRPNAGPGASPHQEAAEHGPQRRIAMSDVQVEAAGITLDTSSPAPIRSFLPLPGEIRLDEDRTAHVVPRVAGVVESVSADLGQQVRRGQVLAVLSSASVSSQRSELRTAQQRLVMARATHEREQALWAQKISPEQDVLQARQALREAEITVANAAQQLAAIGASASTSTSTSALGRYELRAPLDGTVIEKHIALGESVKDDAAVFTLSNLSTVWAEFSIAATQLAQVRVGERVVVRSTATGSSAEGTVSYVGALIGEQTRSAQARVTVASPQGVWRPGLFVTVEVMSTAAEAAVTVAADAIQTLDARPTVFVKVPGGFVPRAVRIGRSDGKRVEIVSGLEAGAEVAAAGSFVVKAEQGKGSATHTH